MTKIQAMKVEIPFTEYGGYVPPPWVGAGCIDRASVWLRTVQPPELGYYKTDFEITYTDGEVYEGRYDIGADSPTLGDHILHFAEMLEDWKYPDEADVQGYRDFIDRYELGTTTVPSMPTGAKEPAHEHTFTPIVTVRPGMDRTWIIDINWSDSFHSTWDNETAQIVESVDEELVSEWLDQVINEDELLPSGKEVVRRP